MEGAVPVQEVETASESEDIVSSDTEITESFKSASMLFSRSHSHSDVTPLNGVPRYTAVYRLRKFYTAVYLPWKFFYTVTALKKRIEEIKEE